MEKLNVFESFDGGKLLLLDKEIKYSDIVWSKHPVFEGVKLKHLVTASETNGQFSYHLVEIAPNKKIGLHIH